MSKKLNGYKGRLNPAQIAAGMNAAVANACRLVTDADTLMNTGSFPTAASLAILAIEEAGKCAILRALSVARSEQESTAAWKEYRSHTNKNISWILPQLVSEGARKIDDFYSLFDDSSDHPYVLDNLMQLGFYTDCLGNAHWSKPEDVIEEHLAQTLVEIARIFARGMTHSEQEIEMWIEHLGPVWKKDIAWMKQGLVNWYAAMQAAGLTKEGENHMEQFVRS
jgi:AbiV family abortive infection protein